MHLIPQEKILRKLLRSFFLFLGFLFLSNNVSAVNYVSNVAAGSWGTPATWLPVGTPTAADNVTILAGAVITENVAAATCNNLTLTGTLNFTVVNTVTVSGNMTMNSGSLFNGTATGIVNVNGTFTVAAGGTSTISRATITVTGISTVNGTLACGNATGTKTFNGNFIFNNGSAVNYIASETLVLNANLTCNGTVTISGATAGLMTVAGTATFSAGCSVSISDLSLTISGATQIDGTVIYLNNNGTKTFGDITISATGNWNASAVDEMFVLNGNLTNNGIFSAHLQRREAMNIVSCRPLQHFREL